MAKIKKLTSLLLALWMTVTAMQLPALADDTVPEETAEAEISVEEALPAEEPDGGADTEAVSEIAEPNAITFTPVEDLVWKAEHAEYIHKAIAWHAENSKKVKSTLEAGKNAVFFFDGVSNNLDGAEITESGYLKSNVRYNHSAVCVVVHQNDIGEPEIIYACEASTMADNVRGTGADGGRPTVVDGIYDLVTVNHKGSSTSAPYAAHDITYLKVIRCNNTSVSTTFEYVTEKEHSTGIHVHAQKNRGCVADDDPNNKPDSTGCFVVGKCIIDYPAYYNNFMNIMGFDGKALTFNLTTRKYVCETYPTSQLNQANGVIVVDHYNYKEAMPTIFGDDVCENGLTGEQIADLITENSVKWYDAMNATAEYTLSGVIRNATEGSVDRGKEVEGVTVTRKTADGTVIDSTTTDANGTFSFTFTGEKGDYIFMFSKTGFQTKETAVITIYQSSPSLGAFVIYEEEGEVEIVDQGTCGTNLTWTLNSAGTLTISGEGEMEDYQYDCGPWKDYCYSYNETKPQIKRIVVNDGVTTIGKYAFNGCKRATSVYLSNTLAEIDWHAFANCEQLVNIELPDSLLAIRSSAFYRCSSLTSITIPKNVWIIESRPFYDCTNLSYIHVNNENESFRDIDGVLYKVSKTWIYEKEEYEYSFTELLCCPAGSSLTEVLIPDTVTSIAMDAFANCTALLNITTPSSVTEIKSGVFFRCSNLKNIVLHDAITRIGSLSFNGCQKLQELNLPQELNYIDDTALGDCYCLSRIYIDDSNSNYCTDSAGVLYNKAKTILFKFPARSDVANYTIPSTVTKINDDAMQNCIYLENIELPKNLVEIGWSAFENCVKLQSITIPETVTTIGHSAFSGCTNLTDVFLPDTIPNFGSGVFKRCTNLQKISLPKNMTKLPDVTFSECTSLTTIIWPIALEKIGYMSFSKCSSLTEITIPETVYEIGNYNVFEECTNLTKVILSDAITTLGSSIFRNCINLTDIHLPDSLISLGRNNFDGCTSLKRIDIPESLTVFERQNFYGAKNLTSVYFYGDAPTIPAGTFDNFSNLTLYYIEGKAGWTSPTWKGYNTATFTPGSVDPNPTVPGDLTGDGVLDYFDVSAIYAAYQSGEVDADTMDVNNDGVVDYYDVSKLYAAFRGTATLT